MKLSKYLLMGAAITFGLVACDSDDVPNDETERGGSYANVTIALPSTRAGVNDGQNNNAGTDEENKVASVDLYSDLNNLSWSSTEWTLSESKIETKAKSAKPGQQIAVILVNKGSIGLTNDENKEFGFSSNSKVTEDIDALTKDNQFVMTANAKGINILPNIKEGEAKTKNNFEFDIERVVAKGVVYEGTGYSTEVKDGSGTVKEVKFAAINGATKTYILRNKAGERTLGTNQQYDGFESAIHAIEPNKDADKAFKSGLIRLGEVQKQAKDLGKYTAQSIAGKVSDFEGTKGVATGIYFMENSGKLSDENKTAGFYRYAYAKIYVTFTPKKICDFTSGTSGAIKEYNFNESPNKEEDGTFYKGANDGRLYASKKAAEASSFSPGQNAYTYKGGKCAYRALWNRQVDSEGKVINVDTRRNNIYALGIKTFSKLGMPWDPSDPSDPNLPKPDGDSGLPDPDDPSIENQDTYMQVEAKILPWNVVHREIEL